MGIARVAVPLDRGTLGRVDKLVERGRFSTRGEALAAVIKHSLARNGNALTPADVLRIVKKGREEYRRRKVRLIGSSAELR